MFKISNKVRRLTNEEKERYLKDGYLTGLPVFDVEAKDDLNDLFVSLSSRLSNDIDINQFLQLINYYLKDFVCLIFLHQKHYHT